MTDQHSKLSLLETLRQLADNTPPSAELRVAAGILNAMADDKLSTADRWTLMARRIRPLNDVTARWVLWHVHALQSGMPGEMPGELPPDDQA
jgi:hypothetical protein